MGERRKLTVFYDGSCPLCAREISFYRRRKGADAIDWLDIGRSEMPEVAPELSREEALSRFHVRRADGRIVSGGEAFVHLWAALPAFRFAGRILKVRPIIWCLDRAYGVFLRIRPRLQTLLR